MTREETFAHFHELRRLLSPQLGAGALSIAEVEKLAQLERLAPQLAIEAALDDLAGRVAAVEVTP